MGPVESKIVKIESTIENGTKIERGYRKDGRLSAYGFPADTDSLALLN